MSPHALAGRRRGGWRLRLWALMAGTLLSSVAVPATAVGTGEAGQPEHGRPNVVFAGVAGLSWEDVTARDMPNLYEMAGTDAVASLTARTIRSRTCAVDGWLTVGAGRRATDLIDSDDDDVADRFCRPPPSPVRDDTGGASVPAWEAYVEEQEHHAYSTSLGLLGERLAEHGVCGTAVGPGAALALADESGVVAKYGPNPAEIDEDLISECPVTVVDLGSLPPPARAGSGEAARQEALEARRQVARGIDDLLGELLQELPDDTALLVAGISDSGPTAIPLHNDPSRVAASALRVAAASGPTVTGEEYGSAWLTSASTRWSGIVQLTDVESTLLDYAGFEEPTEGSPGRPWETAGQHPATAESTVSELLSTSRAAHVYRTQSGPFFQLLGVVQVAVLALALVVMKLRRPGRPMVLQTVYVGTLAIASFPVASFLANLAPWAQAARPTLYLWSAIAGITLVVTVIAVSGPWRRRVYGPAGVVGGITAGVMAVDVSTGSQLQQLSLLGLSPVVAGRFYGLGNIPFAIFIIACIVAAGALAQWLLDRGWSRRVAGTATVAIGVVATIVVGSPQAGADVGGILATMPSFAVLVIGVLGVRLTVTKVVAAGLLAVAVFVAIAWLDWLRPAGARTHFGAFFGDLASGEAWDVVGRKLGASLRTLNRLPYYAWSVPAAYAVILWFTRRTGPAAAQDALRRWPVMIYVVWAGLLAGAAAFAANDSGIVIPGLLLTAGVPMMVSAVAAARRFTLLDGRGSDRARREVQVLPDYR